MDSAIATRIARQAHRERLLHPSIGVRAARMPMAWAALIAVCVQIQGAPPALPHAERAQLAQLPQIEQEREPELDVRPLPIPVDVAAATGIARDLYAPIEPLGLRVAEDLDPHGSPSERFRFYVRAGSRRS